jgi:hypothetical protein
MDICTRFSPENYEYYSKPFPENCINLPIIQTNLQILGLQILSTRKSDIFRGVYLKKKGRCLQMILSRRDVLIICKFLDTKIEKKGGRLKFYAEVRP